MSQTQIKPKITVFSKNQCPRCTWVKRRLERKNIPYREINCQEDNKTYEEFGGKTPTDHVIENYSPNMPVVVVEYLNEETGKPYENKSWWFSGVKEDLLSQIGDEYHN